MRGRHHLSRSSARDVLPRRAGTAQTDAAVQRHGLSTNDRRTVLQTASAIGRDFPLRMLRAVCDEQIDIASALQDLQRLEFVHEQSGDREAAFTFKHALTQEAANALS